MAGLIELNGSDFESTISGGGKVLVDFWAPWCGPCRMQTPILEKLSSDASVNAKICKVNVDENGPIAQKYGIASIPTIILFNDGKEADRMVGVQPENVLKGKLK